MQQHAHLYGRRTPREGEQPRSQDAVPRLAGELQNIIDRLFDLLPVVRAYVQHTMEIAEGGTARRTMEAMLLGPAQNPEAKRATRKALLEYCKQDTRATMGVLAWLRAAAL